MYFHVLSMIFLFLFSLQGLSKSEPTLYQETEDFHI
uniref:Uncharacterized protein n=1 Tax=Lepeophtheirus salmonis TaxID=72036 RepID=A0A0K2VIN1_LEPSM